MGSVVLADRAWGGCRCLDRRSPFRPGHILFKGFLGERNFCIRDEKGEKLAWANTLWTYVDLKTGHPTRVPERGAGSVCAAREAGYGLCTAKDRPSGRNGKERVLSDRETSH